MLHSAQPAIVVRSLCQVISTKSRIEHSAMQGLNLVHLRSQQCRVLVWARAMMPWTQRQAQVPSQENCCHHSMPQTNHNNQLLQGTLDPSHRIFITICVMEPWVGSLAKRLQDSTRHISHSSHHLAKSSLTPHSVGRHQLTISKILYFFTSLQIWISTLQEAPSTNSKRKGACIQTL